MPDHRRHRGPHPDDETLFAASAVPSLRAAVADVSWLLSRDYASTGAVKLVGDHYNLTARQRTAVQRCACTDTALAYRRQRHTPPEDLRGETLLVDGYNVLTTVEVALAGGFVFLARDGCYRDVASMHGTWRKVAETRPALERVARAAQQLGIGQLMWYLDAPVSNSGRLKTLIVELAAGMNLPWQVELVPNPDAILAQSPQIIATADSAVLDRCQRWFCLARHVVDGFVPDARLVDLS